MLNEKPNDSTGWKNKLEALDSLPGEAFLGKSEAWEKLHLRLRTHDRRKKAPWYWVAAACLGLIILFAPWRNSTKETGLIKVNVATNQNKKPAIHVSAETLKKTGPDSSPVTVKIKRVTNNTAKNAVLNIKTDQPSSSLSITVSSSLALPELLDATPHDTNVVYKTPVVARKKLRVVHINELGVPVEEVVREEGYADRPSYYRKVTNQNKDVYFNTFTNSHALSNDFIGIKLSPQN